MFGIDTHLLAQMLAALEIAQAGWLGEPTQVVQRPLQEPGAIALEAATIGRAHVTSGPSALLERGVKLRPVAAAAAPAKPEERERLGGEFIAGSFRHREGTRPYKLFVPAAQAAGPRPLVVMLHGCVQSPDDFATGTRMNDLASQHGFLVLYPKQTLEANYAACWNWFKRENQGREQGEAALLAAMTRDVMTRHDVDPRRVYVAGASAGGAMAALLAATHPELYAAVGVHSGVHAGAAHDLSSAWAAMRGASSTPDGDMATSGSAVPTIVFHGDRDKVVHPRNAERVVGEALRRAETVGAALIEEGRVPGGHAYSRTVYRDANGRAVLESWVVHGAGHAWSGGSEAGRFTDSRGPDASEAMVRFFLQAR